MKLFASFFLISILITGGPGLLWAHSGSHDAPPKIADADLPELPEETFDFETLGEEEAGSGAVDYGMDESPESAGAEGVTGDAPLWGKEQEPLDTGEIPMDLSKMSDHDMMEMEFVGAASHKWVSTSQKGYRWAAALTVLAFAVFGFLTFKRPCE